MPPKFYKKTYKKVTTQIPDNVYESKYLIIVSKEKVRNLVRKLIKENFIEKDKRYVGVVEFYVYAENDEMAKIKAKEISDMIKDNYGDSHSKLTELYEQPFATFGNRKIDL